MNYCAAVPGKDKQGPGRPKDLQKRTNILDAASRLFLERGYELTSMDAVARDAEVSKLTIYNHFAKKADLFREIVRARCDQQAGPDNFARYAELPVRQGLTQLGLVMVALVFSSESLRLLRVMQAEAPRHPEIVEIFYAAGPRRVKYAFAELLALWTQQGQLRIADYALATEQFFSLLKGETHVQIMLNLIPQPNEQELAARVQASVDLFLAAYRNAPTQEEV
jgi:TetR/AcrR family transcriptional regulator, mexJK operon transcriptional repressor